MNIYLFVNYICIIYVIYLYLIYFIMYLIYYYCTFSIIIFVKNKKNTQFFPYSSVHTAVSLLFCTMKCFLFSNEIALAF